MSPSELRARNIPNQGGGTLHPPLPSLPALIEREKLRTRIEKAVARLIDALDAIDGDPDAEPWLGASDVSPIVPQWPRCSTDDREEENENGSEIDNGELDLAEHGIADLDGLAEQWSSRQAGQGGFSHVE